MKRSWSDILFIVSDVAIGVYLLFAFSSFDTKRKNLAACNKVNIDIADNATSGFIDAKIVKDRLQKSGIYPIGVEMDRIDTRRIEETLSRSPFVNTAECYKTEGGHVYISVSQRMPVIRIKAANGDDYYVDDNDCVMPTSKYTSDLIIVTGNVDRWYATHFISPLGKVIMENELWKNLIEQINVLPNHDIEIVPRIGDHVVHIGRLPDGKGRSDHLQAIRGFMTRKMTRLEKFYRYGLSEVGWNKYSYIDIEFDNQIICRKRSSQKVAHVAPQPQPAEQPSEASHNEQSEKKSDVEEPTDTKTAKKTNAPVDKNSETQSAKKTDAQPKKKTDAQTKKKSVNANEPKTDNGKTSKKQSSNTR